MKIGFAYVRFEIFTAMTIKFLMFWFVAPYSVVVGYVSEDRAASNLRVKMAAWQQSPSKHCYTSTTLHHPPKKTENR
jgi:hypothetical protein